MPEFIQAPGVRGWFHQANVDRAPAGAVALTHGAGSNSDAKLLVALTEALTKVGYAVLRYDLPFRQEGKPPTGLQQPRDREGIRKAALVLRERAPGVPLYLAGHSYGGRQSTMLAAEDAQVADALLLLSYPLHPPKQPEKLRTEHFPSLKIPSLFIQGTRDEFGSLGEVEAALKLIPARTELRSIDKAPHALAPKHANQIAEWFATFTKG